MKNITFKLITSTILSLYLSVSHAEGETLFKQFKYSQSINSFSNEKYLDCTSEVGQTARCVDNVKFFGYNFTAALLFSDEKLTKISLISDFDETKCKTLIASLPKNGFNIVVIQGKSDRLDVIEAYNKREDIESFNSKLSSFESLQLTNGQITYSFLERSANELKESPNTVTAINKSPEATREIDLMVIEEDNTAQMILTFSLPKIYMTEVKNSGKISDEKF